MFTRKSNPLNLPRNIMVSGNYYLVQVQRAGVRYQALIRRDTPKALVRATTERDRFYREFGSSEFGNCPRSNTGVAGISEMVMRSGSRYRALFSVTHRKKEDCRRFFYDRANGVSRMNAWTSALAYRSRLIGVAPAELLLRKEKLYGSI